MMPRFVLTVLVVVLNLWPVAIQAQEVQWERLAPEGATLLDNIGFAFDPQDADTIYMATRGDQPRSGNSPWAGIWKSTDAGATWRRTSKEAGKTTNGDSSILVSPHDASTMYAASEYEPRLMVSRDKGETWTKIPEKVKHAIAIAIDPVDPDKIWVGADDSIHFSDDDGKSWTHQIESGLPTHGPDSKISSTALYVFTNPKKPGTLYAGYYVADAKHEAGVYKTEDWGKTWRASNRGMIVTPVPVKVNFLRNEGLLAMAQAKSVPEVLYASTVWSYLYRSDDGAENWKMVHKGGMKPGIPWTVTDPDTGKTKTFDTSYRAMGVSPTDPKTVAVGTGLASALISYDGGETWTDLGCVLPARLKGDLVEVDVPESGTQRSEKPLDILGGGKGWATQVSFHPEDPRWLYVATFWGIYRCRLPEEKGS